MRVRQIRRRRSSYSWSGAQQFESENFFCFLEIFCEAPGFEQVLETGFLSISPISIRNENANDCSHHFQNLVRRNQHAQILREGFVSRRATQLETKINSRRDILD